MYGWVNTFLTERFICTRIKGTLFSIRTLADGLPQGNALSCTLFLIFMNSIGAAVLKPTRLSYADDIVLWQQDIDIDKATESNSRDFTSLKRFCERWKMQTNTVRLRTPPSLSTARRCRRRWRSVSRKDNDSTEAGSD
ncbi:endonuclease-reverse transcriptase [Plakobranchus ocellatus]|uniref:Endonuclease-reverse transcriptase n=1 Tax=Plakobranchus ocellatus TaxID=259542 RepID=A0AAV4DPT5_9GAST|nr:endonuclease-reverse transcriptase [Plakobranchus ocellatus]